MTKKFYGWWIVATCFFTFGISTGLPYYNIAFYFDYFEQTHQWARTLITLGAPVAVLLTIWIGPVIVPRVSPRLLIIIGTGMTFLSFQWFSRLSGAQWEYFGAWSLYMMGYFLSGPIPHQILISNWFRVKRGRAMGITYVGVAIVGSIGTKLSPYLINELGLHFTQALSYLSLIFLLAWPLAFFFLKDRPSDIGQHPDGIEPEPEAAAAPAAQSEPPPAARPLPVAAAVPATTGQTFAELLRQMPFWMLLIGSAMSIGSIAAVNFLMKFVFEDQGFKDQDARDAIWSTAQFWVLWASIGGRLLAGYLADKFPRKYVMLATYLIVALAIPSLFLVRPESEGYVYLFALVFGFAMGADYMLIPLMAADQFGLSSLARAMSGILPADTIAQFWLPNLIERVRLVLLGGDYQAAMMAVFATAFIGAMAIAALPKRPRIPKT
ncbi:MAG: MFS transporter [Bryobacteraceae bacterium]|nr:MFS transporter [Bryobacteraceae bacterium]